MKWWIFQLLVNDEYFKKDENFVVTWAGVTTYLESRVDTLDNSQLGWLGSSAHSPLSSNLSLLLPALVHLLDFSPSSLSSVSSWDRTPGCSELWAIGTPLQGHATRRRGKASQHKVEVTVGSELREEERDRQKEKERGEAENSELRHGDSRESNSSPQFMLFWNGHLSLCGVKCDEPLNYLPIGRQS